MNSAKTNPARWVRAAALPVIVGAFVTFGVLTQSEPLEAETGSVYKHSVHENIGLKLKCEGCHGSSKDGTLVRPGTDAHKPCTNSSCHAAEYRRADSKFCYVCHTDNKPWDNPLKEGFTKPGRSEFWVGFSHKDHFGRAKKGNLLGGAGCGTCHPTQAGVKPRPVPAGTIAPGHLLCNSCHEELAAPAMTECGGCHMRGGAPAAGDTGAATPDKWRVSDKFTHETHRVDVRTAKDTKKGDWGWERYDKTSAKSLDCATCHGNVAEAGAGVRPPRPTMAGCATCHNGTHSFKVTGFECHRCHGPNVPTNQPASSPASKPNKGPTDKPGKKGGAKKGTGG